MEKERLVSLVRAVQSGNEAAAGDLYDAFYDGIYYFILKSVDNDPELAADLTQDTFLEILETIHKLQEPAAFVTWSKQIAYHKCTAYFRKHREILLDEQEDGYSVFDTVEEERKEFIPDEALDKEDFKQTIQSMINDLPKEQRSALVLRYFNEISVKEIAQIQGVSEGTVKSRLNYARKAIQQAVESYEKRSGVRLHITGVVPMLLWFFRACRRGKNMAVATGTAGAAYTGLGSSASTSAAGTGAAAAGTGAAVATGAKVGLAAATKVAATKVVAVVAAAAVGIAGATAVVTNLLSKPKPEIWSGYVEESQVMEKWAGTPENGHLERTVTPVEGGRMHFRMEILETEEYAYTGNLTVTWEDGEVYHSDFYMIDYDGISEEYCYTLCIDPMYARSEFPDDMDYLMEYQNYLGFIYHSDTDKAAIEFYDYGFQLVGELSRENPEKTILLTKPIQKTAIPITVNQDGELLQYMKDVDGNYGWFGGAESEAIDEFYAETPQDGGYRMGYPKVVYLRKPDSGEVTAHIGVTRQYQDPINHAKIEEEVDGMPVTRIRDFTNRDMEYVDIPDSVTIIEGVAFYDNVRLKKVEIPGSVRHIGDIAFFDCLSLENITFEEGLETIGELAFKNCAALKEVELPEGLKYMGSMPFERCASLRKVTLPSTLVDVDYYLFYRCPSLEILEVAEGNPRYHSSGNCIIETESKTLFAGCKGSDIPADGSVTAIGRYAFAANTGIDEITVPEGITEIRYCAFVKSSLRKLYLPRSLTFIDDQAFKDCQMLKEIHYAGTKAEFMEIRGIRWDAPYHGFDVIIHCTDGDLAVD